MPDSRRFDSPFGLARVVIGPITLAVAIVWPGGRAHGQADRHSFPVGPTRDMYAFDPRWSSGRLVYSLIDGDRVMVEGDLVLGKEDEVRRRSWANAVRFARDAVNRADLMAALVNQEDQNEARWLAKQGPGDMDKADGETLVRQVDRAVKAVQPFQNLRPSGPPQGNVEQQAAGIFAGKSGEFRWPNGVIPYEEDKGLANPKLLKEAIDHWEERTGKVIRFVKRDQKNAGQHPDYVSFESGTAHCYAYSIGRTPGLGLHRVTLAANCLKPQYIHEIGHIVGLVHEHCRPDIDLYMVVDKKNMMDDAKAQFQKIVWKEGEQGVLTKFDFGSIMLYPYKAFAEDVRGGPTLLIRPEAARNGAVNVPADPATFGLDTGMYGGKTEGLSDLDVEAVKTMYKP
jgi:hypothetical protein